MLTAIIYHKYYLVRNTLDCLQQIPKLIFKETSTTNTRLVSYYFYKQRQPSGGMQSIEISHTSMVSAFS